jgi:hypothetical protein
MQQGAAFSSKVIIVLNLPFWVVLLLVVLMLCCCALQEKFLTPKQVSGLESLLVPPLAATWQRLTGSQQHAPILFGTQLSAALQRAAAAAGRDGPGSYPAGQGLLLQQALQQQALQQQKSAADKQYLLLLTGKRQKVRPLHCLVQSAGTV